MRLDQSGKNNCSSSIDLLTQASAATAAAMSADGADERGICTVIEELLEIVAERERQFIFVTFKTFNLKKTR
jgi:hypothetical protein